MDKHLPSYVEVQPLLVHVRIMNEFFRTAVDTPERRAHLPALHCAYMELLQPLLAPHALTLALAIAEIEEAFPHISERTQGSDPRSVR